MQKQWKKKTKNNPRNSLTDMIFEKKSCLLSFQGNVCSIFWLFIWISIPVAITSAVMQLISSLQGLSQSWHVTWQVQETIGGIQFCHFEVGKSIRDWMRIIIRRNQCDFGGYPNFLQDPYRKWVKISKVMKASTSLSYPLILMKPRFLPRFDSNRPQGFH